VLAARWRLDARIGSGSFGSVWAAVDVGSEARVAVKLLHAAHAQNTKVLGRFVQEARIQAQLSHPAVVPVLDWRTEPVPFLVMPLVEGESLHDRCHALAEAGRGVPLAGVTWLVEQMTGAVAAAHDAGVVHRDLKPKNVLVNRRRQRPFVRVLDFGVAKILEGGRLPATTVGRVMGSVLYLAPEQVTGGEAPTVAVDQFALASIAFELLTGRRAWARDADGQPLPFDVAVGARGDNNQMAVLRRIVGGDRPDASSWRPEAGRRVAEVVKRGMASRPEDRFPDVRAFGEALRRALTEAAAFGPRTHEGPALPAPASDAGGRPVALGEATPVRARGEVWAGDGPTGGLLLEPTLPEGARPSPAAKTEVTARPAEPRDPTDEPV
jgi:serine/threonine-protein kinase